MRLRGIEASSERPRRGLLLPGHRCCERHAYARRPVAGRAVPAGRSRACASTRSRACPSASSAVRIRKPTSYDLALSLVLDVSDAAGLRPDPRATSTPSSNGRRTGAAMVLPAHDGSIEVLRHRRNEFERVRAPARAEPALDIALSKERTLAWRATSASRARERHGRPTRPSRPKPVNKTGLPAVLKPQTPWVVDDRRPGNATRQRTGRPLTTRPAPRLKRCSKREVVSAAPTVAARTVVKP